MGIFRVLKQFLALMLLLLFLTPSQTLAQYGGFAPVISASSNFCVDGSPHITINWGFIGTGHTFDVYRHEYTPLSGGDGLTGNYFDKDDFTDLEFTRVDETIDFDWGEERPHPDMGDNSFSIYWTGTILPPTSDNYTFSLTSDDGANLYLNNTLVINNLNAEGLSTKTGSTYLSGNQMYTIALSYIEDSRDASVKLQWSNTSLPTPITVPKSVLFSTPAEGTKIAENLPPTTRSFTDDSTQSNTLYSYRVVAVDADSSTSSIWLPYQITGDCDIPVVDNASFVSSCTTALPSVPEISFSWTDDSTTRTSYNIYRRNNNTGQNFLVAQILDPSQKTFTDNPTTNPAYPLENNTSYRYQVGGVNNLGVESLSVWSNIVTTVVDCSLPRVNLSLSSGTITKNHTDLPPLNVKQNTEDVVISWSTVNIPAGPSACTASIPSTNPAPSAALLNVWSNNKSEADTQLLPPISRIGDYLFRLICRDSQGDSYESNIILRVTQLQKPFIQTTGGDIHTNESITIPRVP